METCGTGWHSGCPSVPCGLRSVPGGSARPPLARADDRGRDPTSAFLLGPHRAVCWGSAASLPLSGSRLPAQPQERPSQALVMQCPGRPSSWVGCLWGPVGTQHHEPGAELPVVLLRCSPHATPGNGPVLMSVFLPCQSWSGRGGSGPREGCTSLCPEDGAPKMPSWDLGRCSVRRLPELPVVSCNVRFGEESLDFFPFCSSCGLGRRLGSGHIEQRSQPVHTLSPPVGHTAHLCVSDRHNRLECD